jgi:hypothetical protein
MIDPENAALFRLGGERDIGDRQQRQYSGGKRPHAPHASLLDISASNPG